MGAVTRSKRTYEGDALVPCCRVLDRHIKKRGSQLTVKRGRVTQVLFVRSQVAETEMFVHLPVDPAHLPVLERTAKEKAAVDVRAYDPQTKSVYSRGKFTLTRVGARTALLSKLGAQRSKPPTGDMTADMTKPVPAPVKKDQDELFLVDEVVPDSVPPTLTTLMLTRTYPRQLVSTALRALPRAIPSTWNGVNYRSRLEAKFARLLELMNIRFLYEPVKCAKAGGGTYTIDFFLPDQQLYVELKPKRPHVEEEERCEEMSAKGFRVALLYGSALHQPPFRSELFLGKPHRDYKHHDALRGMAWSNGKKLPGDTVFVHDEASGKVFLDQVESVRDTRWAHPAVLAAYSQLLTELPTLFG